jgi:hypothetical protein
LPIIKEPFKKLANLGESTQRLINENFHYISPVGKEKEGVEGFEAWCHKQNLEVIKTAQEYIAT